MIKFKLGEIYFDERIPSQAELMDYIISLENRNRELEARIEELCRLTAGQGSGCEDIYGNIPETRGCW